jgi:aspartate/methionine/tyrosine aminotransferase
MIDLMVNPFEGMSDATKSSFLAEYERLKKSIRHRGRVMADALEEMDHVNCKYADGSMYIYPSVRFSKQAVAEAEGLGRPVDQFYCHQIQ